MASSVNLVRVVSTTVGTGTLTLGAAVQGFLTPTQAGAVDGVIYSYAIEADYVNNIPTSREVGTGTLGASGTTLTRTVVNSTNTNALLSLTGDEQVFIAVTTKAIRELIAADRSYYIRTDGSDSNTGLANTAGAAWLTLQHAYDYITANLDTAGYTITVNVAAGTYTAGVSMTDGWTGGGGITWTGDTTTPANVFINVTANTCFDINLVLPGVLAIAGFKVANSSANWGIWHRGTGVVLIGEMNFGTCAGSHIYMSGVGGELFFYANYSITGNADRHCRIDAPGNFFYISGLTITLTGTPAWTTDMIENSAPGSKVTAAGVTFTGSATGKRYAVSNGGVIDTNGGGINYFPGNSAGTGTNFAASPWGLYL